MAEQNKPNEFTQHINELWDENPDLHALGTQQLSVSMPGKLWIAIQSYHGIVEDEYGTPGSMAAYMLAQSIGFNDAPTLAQIGGKKLSEAEKAARKAARDEKLALAREAAKRFKEQSASANRTTDIAALRGSLDAKAQAEAAKTGSSAPANAGQPTPDADGQPSGQPNADRKAA